MGKGKDIKPRHIVLIGASVGKAWNISELHKRMRNNHYFFEYVGLYKFDKSSALEQILRRQKNKPDVIILKECAAYFPGDVTFDQAKSLMKSWVRQYQDKGIALIPTTVAPVTHAHDERFKTHNPFKRIVKRILRISMKTSMQRIIEYNDWIKGYPKQEGRIVLDLEAHLRISDTKRYLRDDLTKGDGLHLNDKAYRILDSIVIPTLEKLKP